jgi:hypothetical protein
MSIIPEPDPVPDDALDDRTRRSSPQITAAVLRPTTKSVDASLLLARTVTPEPMRPAAALAMSRSVLPHRRLLDLDRLL